MVMVMVIFAPVILHSQSDGYGTCAGHTNSHTAMVMAMVFVMVIEVRHGPDNGHVLVLAIIQSWSWRWSGSS